MKVDVRKRRVATIQVRSSAKGTAQRQRLSGGCGNVCFPTLAAPLFLKDMARRTLVTILTFGQLSGCYRGNSLDLTILHFTERWYRV
jgi:hypothetical protein